MKRLSRIKVDWVGSRMERINGQLSNWLDRPFHADFLLEKVSEQIFLGLHNNKAEIQTSITPVNLRELPQEWDWFAVLQLQAHGISLPMKWSSRIQGDMAKWNWSGCGCIQHCRTPFVIQLLLLNNKNCLKLLKTSFWTSERKWMKQEYDPVLNQWAQWEQMIFQW